MKPLSAAHNALGSPIYRARDAIADMAVSLDYPALDRASQAIYGACWKSGKCVVTGIGKAGLIGRKAAATLCSTGSQAVWLDPTDALHGDLGVIGYSDICLVLSNSGESTELVRLLPHIRKMGVKIVALTAAPGSSVAGLADIHVAIAQNPIDEGNDVSAPTASTTCLLVACDALAMAILARKTFKREDYIRYHPGGALAGKSLRVADVMRMQHQIAWVLARPEVVLSECVAAMTRCGIGICCVTWPGMILMGVVTDGDIRRALAGGEMPRVLEDYSHKPVTVGPRALVADAMRLFRENHVNAMPVVEDERVQGVVDIQDIVGLRIEV